MFQKNLILKDRYHLRERIGEGGFAVVWRAEDIFQGQPLGMVAIKEVPAAAGFS